MAIEAEPTPPKGTGPLTRNEAGLAFKLLSPTFLIVLAIVALPLLANFWISFKAVKLADLRAPIASANERLRGDLEAPGDEAELQYRLRNTSQTAPLSNIRLTDVLPEGVTVVEVDPRCVVEAREVSCDLGDAEGGWRDRVILTVSADRPLESSDFRETEAETASSAVNPLTSLDFTLENFSKVFNGEEFWRTIRITLIYTIFGTGGALILGLFAALLLQEKFFARGLFRGLLLFPYVAPVIAVAFTWVLLLDPFSGSLNALLTRMGAAEEPINFLGQRAVEFDVFGWTLEFPLALSTVIAFEAWRYFPLSFLFILARMQSVPSDLYEAAEMDGATPFQQFWSITLPQLAGILSVLFLLRFIWTFNKFDDIFLLTGGAAGTRTLTVQVYEQGFALHNLGAGAAVAVVVFVVLLTFSLFYFRFLAREEGL